MDVLCRPMLRRLLTLDRLLRAGKYPNAVSAARTLEVCTKTVHRDFEFLRDSLGAPLAFCHERNGWHYTDADYRLDLPRLSEGELVALFLAERLLQQYRDTPFAQDIATLLQKVTAALDETVSFDLTQMESISFRPLSVAVADAERFGELTRAVRNGRQLRLSYWSASRDAVTERVVDPYHLTSLGGDWYLIAWCHRRREVLMFAPGRIRALHETGAHIERPADFSIENYLGHSFRALRGDGKTHRVRLRFSPAAARYVRERTWHPSQRLASNRDGGLILTFKVGHLLEVKRWALSWGSDCEILEPPELRREVHDELRRMLQCHQ